MEMLNLWMQAKLKLKLVITLEVGFGKKGLYYEAWKPLPGPEIKIRASHSPNDNLQAFTSHC